MENDILPVSRFKGEILEKIKNNAVTIITAETGAGKSTQVPQFLLEEGYRVVVTQPRRLAARSVAKRVAKEYGCQFGGAVGFRTAFERYDSAETQCLFVTDGLALVRELMGSGKRDVLVLDEVHEWNLNLEVLVAWAKKKIQEEAAFKVVIMSATMEAEKLAEYFGGAPVVSVPGRIFPVEDRQPAGSLIQDVAQLLREGRNVLVFQPGKREIEETISKLSTALVNEAEILPLHGDLTPEEQDACFRIYEKPKCVVATNVAQTSVTIPDIDAVVDSGMERRVELAGGVEGLYLKPISQADASQRKGRAGRTKPGVYIDYCSVTGERPAFPRAEILRVRLDQAVLRLAEVGIDVEYLEFFHQPDKNEIHEAKRALRALGCMDETGRVTDVGCKVARLPISVKYGRMVVEAEARGVVDDMITIAALLEQGEITIRKTKDGYLGKTLWGKLCPGETESDIMAQLAVFEAAREMSKEGMVENGVFVKAFFQAKEKRRHLADSLRGRVRFGSSGDREQILKSICCGMVDHLYKNQYGEYRNGDGQTRRLSEGSVVETSDWLVGIPFDLEVKTRRGGFFTLNLVTMATKVEPDWLGEVAPQLVRVEEGISPAYDSEKDSCISTERIFFQDQMIREGRKETPSHPDASKVFISWLASKMAI